MKPDITKSDVEPQNEIGVVFIDPLGQHWKYCGILMGRDFPLIYKWIPTAFYVWIKAGVEPEKITILL